MINISEHRCGSVVGGSAPRRVVMVVVIDSGVAERIVSNVEDLPTLCALDRVNKMFHSFVAIKLKAMRMQCCVNWITERTSITCWEQLRGFQVCVIGDTGTGKTCIVELLTGGKFLDMHQTTLGSRFAVGVAPLPCGTVKLELWDTGGQARFHRLLPMYYRSAPAILLVYDVTNMASFTALTGLITEIRALSKPRCKVLLCGNKADIGGVVTYSQGLEFAKSSNCDGFIEVSAKNKKNIPVLLTALAQLALEGTESGKRTEPIKFPRGVKPVAEHSRPTGFEPCLLM
ncbi:small GTP-binding protein [Pelomyxa schiedti]|nr:small GTP-binding protein [Pelomyxa schiedti]